MKVTLTVLALDNENKDDILSALASIASEKSFTESVNTPIMAITHMYRDVITRKTINGAWLRRNVSTFALLNSEGRETLHFEYVFGPEIETLVNMVCTWASSNSSTVPSLCSINAKHDQADRWNRLGFKLSSNACDNNIVTTKVGKDSVFMTRCVAQEVLAGATISVLVVDNNFIVHEKIVPTASEILRVLNAPDGDIMDGCVEVSIRGVNCIAWMLGSAASLEPNTVINDIADNVSFPFRGPLLITSNEKETYLESIPHRLLKAFDLVA